MSEKFRFFENQRKTQISLIPPLNGDIYTVNTYFASIVSFNIAVVSECSLVDKGSLVSVCNLEKCFQNYFLGRILLLNIYLLCIYMVKVEHE